MQHNDDVLEERPALPLQELRQGRYHALKDACQMLAPAADPRSLRRWIDELGITVYKSPIQGHTSLIAHKDLLTVASRVGRTLKEEERFFSRRTGRPPQPAELKAHYERELDTLSHRIEALQAQHQQEIAALQAAHAQEVAALRHKLQAALATSATAASPPTTGDETRKTQPPYFPPGKMKVHAVPADLPPGTVTVRTFVETHGTTRDIMTAAITRGDLEAVRRPYGDERTQSFFTPQQQDAAVVYLEDKYLPVTRCPLCPHAPGAAPPPFDQEEAS